MEQTLTECLIKCAEAHNKKHEFISDLYTENGATYESFAIHGDSIPLIADVLAIVGGFCGKDKVSDLVYIDHSFGIVEVFLTECRILPEDEIDWLSIRLSLPCDFTHITL